MKFKFNLKLTAFLVVLFVSFLLLILGSNSYCLSFGFILLGFALPLFALYYGGTIKTSIDAINQEIEEINDAEDLSDEDKVYILKELCITQNKLNKKNKSLNFLCYITGFILVILGFINMF